MKEDILQFIKECLPKDDWMDDNDYKEFIDEVLIQSNTSLEQMEEAITIGINNGYSMDDQFKLMREILTKQD
jgi:hypothetical protein